MSLSNAGRRPAAAQSNQDEHTAEDGQQDDADQHFRGALTKKASKPIRQLEEALRQTARLPVTILRHSED